MLAAAKQQFSQVYQRAAESPWGRALAAYYGEKSGAAKIWALASLGEPLWADMYRIAKTREFKAKAFEGIRFREDPKTGQRAPYAADVPRYLKQWQRAMREEIAGNPRRGEELRAKEGAFKRLATDLAFSPMMWFRPVPARAAMEYVAPKVVKAVGPRVVGAIAKRPTAARWLLSPAKRLEQVKGWTGEELTHLWYQVRGALGLRRQVRLVSERTVRRALGRFTEKEIEEGARLAQQFEDLPAYSGAVKAGRAKAASSNRAIEAFVGVRRLYRQAYLQMPWGKRCALPGSREEAAAIARVRAAGGAAKAGKIRLKRGEFRLPQELGKEVEKGKVVGFVDGATGESVTPYRQAYYRLPAKVKAVGAPPTRPGLPRARRPRKMRRPVEARTAQEVYDDVVAAIAEEPRYAALDPVKADVARAFKVSEKLKDPAQREAALDIFRGLEKRLGPSAPSVFRRAFQLLDRWGVTVPKQVYTIYNFAWYVKNYIDTVGVKNLLAGIPLSKLRRFARVKPKDVYGREVEVGVTWTKELTGMDVGASWFARQGNAIENTGRRALWDDVYWKAVRRFQRAGRTTDQAHVLASNQAMRMVAKVHFDYGDLSKLDEVMRRIFPFWMYQRNQLRWMGELGAARPRLVYGGYKFFDVGAERGGPEVRIPGMGTLMVQPAALLSPERYLKTICGLISRDEAQQKRWRGAGALGRFFIAGEKGGFYAHPFLEQGLSAILKRGDLMGDTSWKQVAPLVGAVGKMLRADMTYIGVWRTAFPGEARAPRIEQLKRGYKRRVMMRHAFSILEGEEWGLTRCERYVTREMQVAGVLAFFGVYPKVRERKYDEMQRLLARRKELSFRDRQEFDAAHPEVRMFLMSLSIRQR